MFLACLILFDDQHGIPGFGDRLPVMKQLLGASFAVSFVVFRVLLWPIVSRRFVLDSWDLWGNQQLCHSYTAVSIFLVSNVTLTVLQVVWLHEIIVQARKLFVPQKAGHEEKKVQ